VPPILAANRAHKAISYPQLLTQLQQKTGKQLALRTLQQYGKEELGARAKSTKRRTRDERECTATAEQR
jgi:hypothetical protein